MMTIKTATKWIPAFQVRPQAQLRLFCFSYGGGGASVFRSWDENISQEIEICPVQLPGRENRLLEAPFTRLQPLITALANQLLPKLTVPYAFFGHSMGALVSFELTRHLRRLRAPAPEQLFVSAFRAPQLPARTPPLNQLPNPEFIAQLRALNGTPPAVLENDELMELLLPTLRADFAVCETYRYLPEPPLHCPIVAFGGIDDDEISQQELAAWKEQTVGAFSLEMMSGNHFFIHSSRELLLRLIDAYLVTSPALVNA